MCLGIRLPMISSFFLQLSRKFYAIFLFLFPSSDHFYIMCAIYATTIKRSKVQFRSRQSDSAAPPSHSTPSSSAPSTSAPLLQAMCDSRTSWRSFSAWMLPWCTLYRAVSSERLCQPYCSAAGDHGGFASEVSPPPSQMAFDSKAEDDDEWWWWWWQ